MKKIKINKNNGILFFITGLSGAGKTSTSLKIRKYIIKSFGPTVIIHSEKIRKIYDFKGFNKNERVSLGSQHVNLLNLILKQKINVIYDAIALSNKLRSLKRKKIKNYVEIYIKSDVKKMQALISEVQEEQKRQREVLQLANNHGGISQSDLDADNFFRPPNLEIVQITSPKYASLASVENAVKPYMETQQISADVWSLGGNPQGKRFCYAFRAKCFYFS